MVTEEELKNMSPEEIAELQKQNCIFCKIIAGTIPGKKVYEDEKAIAILDIRPATAGHLLVMPKEHYSILPLIPMEVSKHMFGLAKDLCRSVKFGLPATGTSVFIANGAAAGQQSPHFLFHVIPRGVADGLDFFEVPEKEISQAEIKPGIQKRMGALMKSYLVQEGKLPPEKAQEAMKQQLAMLLDQNPELKKVLMENPEAFKKAIGENPQLAQLFQNVDIDALSKKLKEAASGNAEVNAASSENPRENQESPKQEEAKESNEKQEGMQEELSEEQKKPEAEVYERESLENQLSSKAGPEVSDKDNVADEENSEDNVKDDSENLDKERSKLDKISELFK